MSDQIKEFVEVPRQFVKEGTQFINRCTKPDRRGIYFSNYGIHWVLRKVDPYSDQ
ncbi:1403_t:CDS:2 [Diversispora eburnea]|uniref:1403_t:CDS:1 n=1 Tax=Diversispora eburnea TaxID=1213867 RepID=A0A9N8WTD7_9GLOM|nr:1403_t:CDS:2 [Diversispora eburnea]